MGAGETTKGPERNAETEQVHLVPIDQLHPFEGHPFKVLDDEAMAETVESVSEVGITTPLIVRPDPDGGFEIISGHRRLHAAELAGLETLPVIVREMDDDSAIIMMVDSNLQRESLLPSERAFAYKMKLDALKHQGKRNDLMEAKSRSDDTVVQGTGMSGDTVRRFIRLTNLIPELLDMVDDKKIAVTPATELSYLKPEEQRDFLSAMDYAQAAPSVSQAQRIKKKSQEGACSLDDMCAIMDEVKKDDLGKVSFKTSDLQKFFPKSFTPQQMSNTILRLLEQWQRRRERDQTVARPGQPPEVMKETESWEEVESQGCFDCLEVVSDNALDIDRLMMVFDGRRVLYLGQERYLLGPVVIYKCDEEGDSVSLSAEDVIAAVVYFVNHTVTLCGDGKDFKAFRI